MVRSWRDRTIRFGTGLVTGALLVAGFRRQELWTYVPIVVLLGLFTADEGSQRHVR